jgi:hypothetical protein
MSLMEKGLAWRNQPRAIRVKKKVSGIGPHTSVARGGRLPLWMKN